MALQITGQIELNDGTIVNELYSRCDIYLSIDGELLTANPQFALSKELFFAGLYVLPNIQLSSYSFYYNREIDGDDLLLYSLQQLTDGFETQYDLQCTIIDM